MHSAGIESVFLPVEVDGDIRPAACDLSESQRGDVAPGPQRLAQHMSDLFQTHLPRRAHDPVTQTHREKRSLQTTQCDFHLCITLIIHFMWKRLQLSSMVPMHTKSLFFGLNMESSLTAVKTHVHPDVD